MEFPLMFLLEENFVTASACIAIHPTNPPAKQWVQMERALKTHVCTGEDIYLKEGFLPLLEAHAVNVIHPDLATSGGILETKKIGDLAQEHGISMALHMAGTPISTMAAVHCAAATENFIALEHHFTDIPFLGDFIDGIH